MLSRRYTQAEKQRELSRELLEDLEASSDAEVLAGWKALEVKARQERQQNLKVMEVYEVTSEKGKHVWAQLLNRH